MNKEEFVEWGKKNPSAKFIAHGDSGEFEGEWLDPYFEMVRSLNPKYSNGFVMLDNLIQLIGKNYKFEERINARSN